MCSTCSRVRAMWRIIALYALQPREQEVEDRRGENQRIEAVEHAAGRAEQTAEILEPERALPAGGGEVSDQPGQADHHPHCRPKGITPAHRLAQRGP